ASANQIICYADNLICGSMERKGMRTARKPERIGQLLTVAAAAAQSLARERLRPLGLTPRGWAVLSALAEEGPRPQIDLAAATGLRVRVRHSRRWRRSPDPTRGQSDGPADLPTGIRAKRIGVRSLISHRAAVAPKLRHRSCDQWATLDSNQRPSPCKGDALTS